MVNFQGGKNFWKGFVLAEGKQLRDRIWLTPITIVLDRISH